MTVTPSPYKITNLIINRGQESKQASVFRGEVPALDTTHEDSMKIHILIIILIITHNYIGDSFKLTLEVDNTIHTNVERYGKHYNRDYCQIMHIHNFNLTCISPSPQVFNIRFNSHRIMLYISDIKLIKTEKSISKKQVHRFAKTVSKKEFSMFDLSNTGINFKLYDGFFDSILFSPRFKNPKIVCKSDNLEIYYTMNPFTILKQPIHTTDFLNVTTDTFDEMKIGDIALPRSKQFNGNSVNVMGKGGSKKRVSIASKISTLPKIVVNSLIKVKSMVKSKKN